MQMNPTSRFFALVPWVVGLAIVSCTVLAAIYFKHVPLLQDGGWYSYPAYAIAEGGDPSENVPGYEVDPMPDRVVTKFLWENRTNLTVPILRGWFEAVGSDWRSLRYAGVLQWLAIAAFCALVVSRASGGKHWLAALAFGFAVSDSVLLASAISNARPDVTIALWSVVGLFSLTQLLTRRTRLWALPMVVIFATLPLLHVTSAIAVAVITSFCLLCALSLRRREPQSNFLFWILLLGAALPAVMFLVRQPLLDVLIPTEVPASLESVGQHSLVQKLQAIASGGLAAKLAMEWPRWRNYFVLANAAHLLLIIAGLVALFGSRAKGPGSGFAGDLGRQLFVAVGVGSVVQLCIDPHGTSSHLVVLAQFAIVAAMLVLGESISAREGDVAINGRIAGAVLALLVVAVGLKAGHAISVYAKFARQGMDNERLERVLTDWVEREAKPVAAMVGPAELWPYMSDLRRPVLIVDRDRSKVPASLDAPDFRGVRTLVVNEDYWNFGWSRFIEANVRSGRLALNFSMGECGRTVACVAMYTISPATP